MKIEKQGRIEYDISIIMTGKIPDTLPYSKDHWMKILEYNMPGKRTVYFNGVYARTEEITTDYGFKSKTIIIRKANSLTYTYCKIFPEMSFCLDIQEQPGSQEYFRPQLTLLDEFKEIGGHRCRKGIVQKISGTYEFYFTTDFSVGDPTGAVIQEEGVDGFIMEQTEMPASEAAYFYKRYNVSTKDFTPVPQDLFEIPASFIKYPNIEAVRKENRRLMNEKAEKQLQKNPLTEQEKKLFNGYWLGKSGDDQSAILIQYTGSEKKWENKYSFSSKNLNTNIHPPQEWVVEEASLLGRDLLVEDPPNFRIYVYDKDANSIQLSGTDHFAFERSNQQEIDTLIKGKEK